MPAADLGLRLPDLPRRHAEHAGEPVRVAAAGAADLRQGAHGVGQRIRDQHRRDAEHQRPAQRLERTHPVAGHDLVRHREARGLGTAAVVTAYRVRVDRAAGVGDELRRGRREVAQLGADRLEEHADRVGRDLPPGPAHLGADEVGPLVRTELLAARDLRPGLAQRVRERLVPRATRVQDRHGDALAGRRGMVEDRRGGVLAGLVSGLQHDDPRLGEQGRAQQRRPAPRAWPRPPVGAAPPPPGRRRVRRRRCPARPARPAAPRRRAPGAAAAGRTERSSSAIVAHLADPA